MCTINNGTLMPVVKKCHSKRKNARDAVFGVDPEDANRAIALKVDDRAGAGDRNLVQRPLATVVGGHQTVALQSQPEPAEVADLLEVLQAGVPAVEEHASGERRFSSRPVSVGVRYRPQASSGRCRPTRWSKVRG